MRLITWFRKNPFFAMKCRRLNEVNHKGNGMYNKTTDIKKGFGMIISVIKPNRAIQTQPCRKQDTLQTRTM